MSTGSFLVVQWVKYLALSLLWYRFDPWPRNFQQKKKKKKKNLDYNINRKRKDTCNKNLKKNKKKKKVYNNYKTLVVYFLT